MNKHNLLTVMLAILPFTSALAFDFEVNGIYYNILSDNKVEVTSGTKKYVGDVTLTRGQSPSEVNVQTQESLSSAGIVERMWFYGCSDVTYREKVTRLKGVNDVGTGRETISCESAAAVSLISSGSC